MRNVLAGYSSAESVSFYIVCRGMPMFDFVYF